MVEVKTKKEVRQKTAMEMFQRTLTSAPKANHRTVKEAATEDTPLTEYIYEFNESDRVYDTSQYDVSGVFDKTTTPWLNDINTVPKDLQWTDEDVSLQVERTAQVESENTYIQANAKDQEYTGTAIEQIQQRFTKGLWDTSVFSQEQIDTLTRNWINDDYEFARQRLGSANPNVMSRYTGTNTDLNNLIDSASGAFDKSELKSRLNGLNDSAKLFVCDYNTTLGSIETNKFVQTNSKPDYMPDGFFFSVPIAFFSVELINEEEVFRPVTIQIDSINKGYIFTTEDGGNAWLLAKLWVASADAQWWFSGTHLFNTHSIDMIFGIAAVNLMEQGLLDETHPMVKLTQPHFKKVFSINSGIYDPSKTDGLYQKGNFCDQFLPTGITGIYQLINNLYENYSFDDQAFDVNIAARNVGKDQFSGHFPYRDDSQIWWNSIKKFVAEIVDATYSSDAEVSADTQLNGWMNFVQKAFNHDGKTRFTWTPTVSYLKQAFTNLFFLTTVQHTAVNDSMFNSWGFIPNGAFAMTSVPPTAGGVGDDQLINSLPNPQLFSQNGGGNYAWPIQNQINFVMNGTAKVTDVAAGNGSEQSLQDIYMYDSSSPQYKAVTNFFNDLWTGEDSVLNQIIANQKKRVDNYKTNNPEASTVPNSVLYEYLSVKLGEDSDLNAPVMSCIQI